ncbi:DUF4157 domain-containing protein [Tenacibaculum sp. 190524A05c]|uniref:eCIS core domain-containing protein n=1 Tax=Tenacibaculum platacis TaxID=3137852 RepID=UPI0032B200B0
MFIRDKKHKQGNQNKDQNKSFIQPKLKMGKPGDKYEVEADKMADQVVNNSGTDANVQSKGMEEEVQQKPLVSEVSPLIQKMEGAEEEQPVQKMEEEEAVQSKEDEEVQMMEEEEAVQSKEDEEVQMMEEEEAVQSKEDEEVQMMEEEEVQAKCEACEGEEAAQKKEEEEVQAKETKGKTNGAPSIENRLRRGSGGQKLDRQTQKEMESGFGADFSKVNIHNDAEAQQMSDDIGAQAFTHGNDIYFNEGKYNPNSKEGKHLLAHELTHTIQQKGMVQKQVQKQANPTYSCTGKAKRGVITPRLRVMGTTDAPNGTVVKFYYLPGAGCSLSHNSIAPFGTTVVMFGHYAASFQSMMTMIPPIGGTFIAVIGNSNSYCCINVQATR